ncbi:MAG: Vgb family protein [Armatimonadota bacterium]
MCERRRAVCVALALVCVTMICSSAAWGVYERNFISAEDFAEGLRDGINFTDEQGGLSLNDCMVCEPFLWVPSPSTNTVARIDARTGIESARYKIGPSGENWTPCAVTTDSQGNAYVACVCPESTGKVVRIAASGGTDSNGDGYINTSGDYDSNKQITPAEVVAWGSDERVGPVFEVGSEGGQPSSLVFDNQGYLWVTLRGDAAVAKLNVSSGKIIAQVDVDGRPSSIVAGDRGCMWVLSRDQGTICQVNTISCSLTGSYKLDCTPVSVCAADDGRLWIADSDGGLLDFDTVSCAWVRNEMDGGAGLSSVVLDQFGDVWAASPSAGYVACFSGKDGGLIYQIPVGNAPSSLSIDSDGYLWALCERSDFAVRIDTRSNEQVTTAYAGASPYCSTPFSACIARKGVCPEGTWRMLVDSEIPGAGWGKINWDSLDIGGGVTVKVRTAETPDMLAKADFVTVSNGWKFSVPDGRYMELVAVLKGKGSASPVLYGLRVEGVNLAPKVESATATLAKILKTDHTMEPVSIASVYDPEGDEFSVTITGITQDEPVTGLGSDDCSPDAICMNESSVWLRGECDPGTAENPGNGRVYTISFKAVDELGAESKGRVKVLVPATLMAKEVVVEDSSKYDSSQEPAKTVCENVSTKS